MEDSFKSFNVDKGMKNLYEHGGPQILDGLRTLRAHSGDELGFASIIEGNEVPGATRERPEAGCIAVPEDSLDASQGNSERRGSPRHEPPPSGLVSGPPEEAHELLPLRNRGAVAQSADEESPAVMGIFSRVRA